MRRPWLVAVLAAAAAGAAAAALIGLFALSQTMHDRPVTLVHESGGLAAALADAPWIEMPGQTTGPVVWVVSEIGCPGCPAFNGRRIEEIAETGARVRIILIARRAEQDGAERAYAAELARRREAADLAPLLEGRPLPAPPAARDPAETEGHLEWGRASLDRLAAIAAANGERMILPAVFWRRGADWRASFGPDADIAQFVDRDLSPDV